jgi:Transcriptional regulator
MAEKSKGMKTKEKIFEAGVALFEERGVEKTSVIDIVKKAGVSKGDFYVHYKSKFSMIEQYVQTLDLNYEEYFQSIPENTPALETLQMVTRKTAEVLVRKIGYGIVKNCYAAMLSSKIDSEMVLNYGRSLPLIYRNIILKGIQNSEFRSDADVDFFVRHLLTAMRGITFEWCISSQKFDLEKEFPLHIELLLEGLKVK